MKKIEGQGEKKKREKPTRPSQKTREFLELVESLIDWKALGKRIDAAYSSDKRGGPRTDPIILVKMILLERWYELSDVKVSKESDERLSFRRFLGLKKDEWAPDDTTISKFRTRLMEAGLHDLIFQQIMKQIEDSGYIVREGCCVIVDATAIPSQTNKGTKNKETGELVEPEATTLGHSKRPPMHGYKCHIAMEEKSKIILGMTVTPSTASEREEFKKLIKGGDKEALADKGYPSRDISDFLDIN
jgi:IS5 family transposase